MAANERGPYLTPNRALSLEKSISRLEGKLTQRIDDLEKRLDTEQRRSALLRRLVLELTERGGITQ